MAKEENKIVLEREYVIPLRKEWLKVPEYKRANKAVKALKEFLVRHMKIYDRDLNKIKIDITLNNEIRFRGMRNPPAKIKIKAKKYNNDIVRVELAEVPQVVRYRLERESRVKEVVKKAREEKKKEGIEEKVEEGKKAEEKEEKAEEKAEEKKEKKDAVIEAGLKVAKEEHKHMKHESAGQKIKKQPLKRMALQK